jgi:hypothetical protein
LVGAVGPEPAIAGAWDDGALTTPGTNTVAGFVVSVVGADVDGVDGVDGIAAPAAGAGLATGPGGRLRCAVTSVTPAASGGRASGSAGPGAVDSPITGPTTRG